MTEQVSRRGPQQAPVWQAWDRRLQPLWRAVWISLSAARFAWMLMWASLCLYGVFSPVPLRFDEKVGLVVCAVFFGFFAFRRARALRKVIKHRR